MKKKTFVSTADALAYVIKRIDGTEVTIGDPEEEEAGGDSATASKKLQVKTYCVYDYESNFIMDVPADAPNFTTFFDLLRYLDSIGKIPTLDSNYMPSDSDLTTYKDYIIPIRGILGDTPYTQGVMFGHRTDLDPSEGDHEFYDIWVITYGFDQHYPYANYGQTNTFSIFNSTDKDQLTYVDDFTNYSE